MTLPDDVLDAMERAGCAATCPECENTSTDPCQYDVCQSDRDRLQAALTALEAAGYEILPKGSSVHAKALAEALEPLEKLAAEIAEFDRLRGGTSHDNVRIASPFETVLRIGDVREAARRLAAYRASIPNPPAGETR